MNTTEQRGMSILDHKSFNFRKWIDNIGKLRGMESTLSISQICNMLDKLDELETAIDDIIMSAFEGEE